MLDEDREGVHAAAQLRGCWKGSTDGLFMGYLRRRHISSGIVSADAGRCESRLSDASRDGGEYALIGCELRGT